MLKRVRAMAERVGGDSELISDAQFFEDALDELADAIESAIADMEAVANYLRE